MDNPLKKVQSWLHDFVFHVSSTNIVAFCFYRTSLLLILTSPPECNAVYSILQCFKENSKLLINISQNALFSTAQCRFNGKQNVIVRIWPFSYSNSLQCTTKVYAIQKSIRQEIRRLFYWIYIFFCPESHSESEMTQTVVMEIWKYKRLETPKLSTCI